MPSLLRIVPTLLLLVPLTYTQATKELPLQFTQKLYHGAVDAEKRSQTFQQVYQVEDKWYKPGGPILFFQGAESPTFQPLSLFSPNDMAPELGAAVVGLQHRFYNASIPIGFDGTNASFASLTIDNIMEDAVNFIKFIKQNLTGAENSKVIAFGGSYGATLVTMLQVRYPDVFWGTMASSPWLRGFGTGDEAKNPHVYKFMDYVSNVYYDQSFAAAEKIKAVLAKLDRCRKDGSCASIFPDLGLCDPQPAATNWSLIYDGAISQYRTIAQYNIAVWKTPFPLFALINATKTATTDSEVLKLPFHINNGTNSSTCIDWTTAAGREGDIGAAFWYTTCTIWPFTTFAVRADGANMFPPVSPKEAVVCPKPEYRSPLIDNSDEWWVKHLQLEPERIAKTKRLLISNAQYDAVSVGVPEFMFPATVDGMASGSRVINSGRLAHVEDMVAFKSLPRGRNIDADYIRDTKFEILKAWLAMNDTPSTGSGSGGESSGDGVTVPTSTAIQSVKGTALVVTALGTFLSMMM